MKKTYRYRSAKTGRFVSKKVAKRRPATTVRETVHCSHSGQQGKRKCGGCGKRLPRLSGDRNKRNKYNF